VIVKYYELIMIATPRLGPMYLSSMCTIVLCSEDCYFCNLFFSVWYEL